MSDATDRATGERSDLDAARHGDDAAFARLVAMPGRPHLLHLRPGTDALWGMYQWLDRAPLGRNEQGPWFKRHDEYGPATVS